MSRDLILEKLRPYQTHPDAASVAASVEWHIRNARLNETALRVLRVLQFRSKIVYGAAWLKLETIADVIGKSVRTVRRALRQLEQAEVIDTYFQTREKSGGSGASVFTIRPALAVVRGTVRPQMSARANAGNTHSDPIEAASRDVQDVPCKRVQKMDTVYNVREQDKQEENLADKPLGKEFIPNTIPSVFVDVVWPFYRDAVKVANLYDRCIRASRAIGDHGVRDDIAVQAFRASIFALKSGKLRESVEGYLYGTYRNLVEQEMAAEERRAYFEEAGINLERLYG